MEVEIRGMNRPKKFIFGLMFFSWAPQKKGVHMSSWVDPYVCQGTQILVSFIGHNTGAHCAL